MFAPEKRSDDTSDTVNTKLSCYKGNKSQGYISTNVSQKKKCLMEDDRENSSGNRGNSVPKLT